MYQTVRGCDLNMAQKMEDASETFWFFFGGAASSLSLWKGFGSSDIQTDGCMQTGADRKSVV